MTAKKLYLVKGELQHGMCNGKQTKHRWLEQVKIMTEITPSELELILGVLTSREMDLKEHLARGYDMKEAIKEVQNTFDKFKKIREDSLKKP